jgi:hypothetical protein
MESIQNKDNLSFSLSYGVTVEKVDNEDNVSISSLETVLWDDKFDHIHNVQNLEHTIENPENVQTNCAVDAIIREQDFDVDIEDYDFVDIVHIDGNTILSSSSFHNIDRFQDIMQQSVDCRDLHFQGRRKSSRVPSLPHIQLTNLFWYY